MLSTLATVDGRQWRLVVAGQLEDNRNMMARFTIGLVWATPLMLAVSALSGYFLTRRALLPVDQFTVNLQPENGDQYLQLAITLQAGSLEESEVIKTNMPKVRSRILLLLSSKHASEINTPEGKQQLSKDIMEAVNLPFESDGEAQEVSEVLFTAFIIQ